MKKQPRSTFPTTINGSRSCYITTKRFAFLTVETILARTIHVSKNILNCFWTLFKNANLWNKRQEKRIRLIFKKGIAQLAHRRALQTMIIASAERLKSPFVQAKFTRILCIWAMHVPNEKNSAIVKPTIRGECATHCKFSQKCHTCRQQKIDSCRDV